MISSSLRSPRRTLAVVFNFDNYLLHQALFYTCQGVYNSVMGEKVLALLFVLGMLAIQPTLAAEKVALQIKIDKGSLVDKKASELAISKDNTVYLVTTDENTQLRRRFWGKATLEEMAPGDLVNVVGRWTDNTKTAIQARLVRDLSIQKRYGIFFGTVTAVSGNTWTINLVVREPQTVTVSSTTKITDRKGNPLTTVNVNDRVRIRGLWNMVANTITEVGQVKDYSLPAR